jgi:hypothetical protein
MRKKLVCIRDEKPCSIHPAMLQNLLNRRNEYVVNEEMVKNNSANEKEYFKGICYQT